MLSTRSIYTKGALLMGIFAVFSSLFSSATLANENGGEPASQGLVAVATDPAIRELRAKYGRLEAMSLSQSHMNRYECYNFEIYRLHDKPQFSCWCLDDRENSAPEKRDIKLENCPISEEDVEKINQVLLRHDMHTWLANYRVPIDKVLRDNFMHVCDATTNSLSARWSTDARPLSAKAVGPCHSDLLKCLRELAYKCRK